MLGQKSTNGYPLENTPTWTLFGSIALKDKKLSFHCKNPICLFKEHAYLNTHQKQKQQTLLFRFLTLETPAYDLFFRSNQIVKSDLIHQINPQREREREQGHILLILL